VGRKEKMSRHKLTEWDFWRRVDKEQACWIYCGGKTVEGRFKGHIPRRVVWRWKHGARSLSPDIWVLYACGEPRCVNPTHLYLGTPGDNWRRRRELGRVE